ncbi:MAG: leucine-rich repeat protein [Bacteroidales bacterium]|nr:leucine-rich repeat protein [Bacteroidales bacterium]
MKKNLFFLSLALMAINASAAVGDTFSISKLAYVVRQEATATKNGQVAVTGLSTSGQSGSGFELDLAATVTNNDKTYDVVEVAANAFKGSGKLFTVVLPYGMKKVGDSAFQGCPLLYMVRVPSSVTSWGKYVVKDCPHLNVLYFNRLTPPSVPADDYVKTLLMVPYEAVDAYKAAAGWGKWSAVRAGSFDLIGRNLMYTSSDGTGFNDVYYTVTSTQSFTANDGNTYAGRVKLVSLATLDYPSTVTVPASVGGYAVTAVGAEVSPSRLKEDGWQPLTKPLTMELGVNVDSVCDLAFYNQKRVEVIKFNPGLKYIGNFAFCGCSIAHDINLPYGLKALGNAALWGNSYAHLLVPSSVGSIASNFIGGNSSLKTLVLNSAAWAPVPTWDITGIPTTCKLYVPTGSVNQYKANPKWGTLQVTAGAFDFTYSNTNMNSTRFHITVTSNKPITVDGVTYAGKAKYVYHPAHVACSGTFSGTNSETYVANGANAKYLMTEFGDSMLYGCSKITRVETKNMAHLERIGHYACYGTDIREFDVPSSCTYIGLNAFVNCKSLSELFIAKQKASRSWGGQFYGDNAADFKCYVEWNYYSYYKQSAQNWTKYAAETNSPVDRLNAFVQVDGDNIVQSFSVGHPVDWEASGLNAYIVSGCYASKKLVYTLQQKATDAGVGLLIDGYKKDEIYKLKRPSSLSVLPMNYLVGTADNRVDVYGESVGYCFDNDKRYFWRPTSSYNLGRGYAYLKLPSNVAGSITRFETDRWPLALKGDVNGDGEVNVSDVTALINRILGTASYADSVCDINADGNVNVSDVTALINQILG